jgi:hypothetical protein
MLVKVLQKKGDMALPGTLPAVTLARGALN